MKETAVLRVPPRPFPEVALGCPLLPYPGNAVVEMFPPPRMSGGFHLPDSKGGRMDCDVGVVLQAGDGVPLVPGEIVLCDPLFGKHMVVDALEGWRPKGEIRMFEDIPDEAERRARLFGEFAHKTGTIFKEWDTKKHVLTRYNLSGNYEYYVGIDTGRSFAAAFVCIDHFGNFVVFDEYYAEGGIVKDHARAILGRCYQYQISPVYYIDPSSQFKAELEEHGIVAYEGSNDVLSGIDRIRRLMYINPAKLESLQYGNPRFRVHEKCTRARWEIERYIWDEWKGKQKYEKNMRDRPKKKDDHMVDAIRYVADTRPDTPSSPELYKKIVPETIRIKNKIAGRLKQRHDDDGAGNREFESFEEEVRYGL